MSRSEDERNLESFDAFQARFLTWVHDSLESRQWHIVVAESGATLVGCMYLRRVDTVPVPGVASRAWGYVTHAFVIEEFRNRGMGRELLCRLIEHATSVGLVELHVWPSRGAISLYARLGFLSPELQRSGESADEPSYVLPLRGPDGET